MKRARVVHPRERRAIAADARRTDAVEEQKSNEKIQMALEEKKGILISTNYSNIKEGSNVGWKVMHIASRIATTTTLLVVVNG